uniref:Reverse transcriptase domain-containing protein n=1 Tax=Tanacetum cinerariifolium TaxID=118510 RepID=A0A699HNK5_TANCI|nr:reverse transcriptase domain-containing protein [Tanacetum cinerariifolium]
MRTRSSSNRIVESSMILRRRNKRSQQHVTPTIVEILIVTMADNRTMKEMLQAPTEGYGEAIVVPDILAENFEIRTGLLSLIQANQFHGFESNNLHDHIRSFNRITSTLKFRNVSNDAIKLMLFPYSLEGGAKIWRHLEKHGKDSMKCLDNVPTMDIRSGNLLSKTPKDAFTIIENKSKVCYSRNKPDASKVSTTSSGSSSSTDDGIDKLTDTISNLVETFNKKMTTPTTVKAVEETCVTCGGAHPYYDCIATDSNTSIPNNQVQNGFSNEFVHYMKMNDDNMRIMRSQMNNMKTEFQSTLRNQNNKTDQNQNEIKKMFACLMNNPSGSGPLLSNTITNPRGDLKAITIQSGVSYDGPQIPPPFSSLPKVVERVPEVTKDTVQPSTKNIQTSVVQTQVPIDEPVVAPKPKPTIPYPFPDALLHMPKFALMFKGLLNNKEKLFDLATTLVNENCSTVFLKKLPEKLGNPGKFLIPCDFLELVECLALADLGVSINLMPLSIWEKLSLPELTPTRIILELVDRSTTQPAGITEDVFVKEGKTGRALINVYGKELTLRVNDEAITFKFGQTSKYSYNDAKSINQIDVIDVACEKYVQEVLEFSEIPKSGNPTPTSEPIIASSSPSFTPFEGNDFILEEIKTFIRTPDELPNLDDDYYDTKGDIIYLEKLLNEDPSLNLPLMKNEDLKQVDATMTKPSIEKPPELELKELPSHLEYAFLEGTDKLPVIISKELKDEE